LVILSIACWTITIQKILQFRKASQDTDAFTDLFWDTRNFARIDDGSRRLTASPLTKVFASGYRELVSSLQDDKSNKKDFDFELIERALRRAEIEESARLEKGVTFLATTASAAPFIGLFGTVWGIMNAFHGLGTAKSSTLQAVAPGISEALVATAVGLAAAIPAAIAYNFFTVTIKRFRQAMSGFSGEFINVAKKSFAR
jgi:biopolymer transport protein TolQ